MWYSLPFNGRLRAFPEIRQEQTLTSLTYTCKAPDLPHIPGALPETRLFTSFLVLLQNKWSYSLKEHCAST